MMSAPTPRVRRAESSSMPWDKPTTVKMRVISTATAITLSRVRMGRCSRFCNTSRLTTGAASGGRLGWSLAHALDFHAGRGRKAEFLGADRLVEGRLLDVHSQLVFVLGSRDHDFFWKVHAAVPHPPRVLRIGHNIALLIEDALANDLERGAIEPHIAGQVQGIGAVLPDDVHDVAGLFGIGPVL